MKKRLAKAAFWMGAFALAAAVSVRVAMSAAGWWIDFGEQPVKSDIMVVLAGDYARPLYAADLYAQGYAPEVWISRPQHLRLEDRLREIGLLLPREESVDRQILMKKGVPDKHIHMYGQGVLSTVDEARSLRREFLPRGMKILIVTSRFHSRRAGMIFRRVFPDAQIRMVSAPDPDFSRAWWKNKELAQNTLLEMFKTLYFFSGGAFIGHS